MDWAAAGALATIVVAAAGYLTHQIHRLEERLTARVDRLEGRFDQLDERDVRHLEVHAAH